MSQNTRPSEGSCCGTPIKGLRRLTFPDGTQVGVFGLDAVMERLYREGRPADAGTAADIMEELKSENYFEPSARPAYEDLFLREYRRFLERKSESVARETNASARNEGSHQAGKKGLFRRLRASKKSANEGAD